MHTTLVLDISSGSVGAALVGIKKGELPEILFKKRQDISQVDGVFPPVREQAVFTALRQVLSDVFLYGLSAVVDKKHPHQIDHALVALSAPWCKSSKRVRAQSSQKPFKYDDKFAQRIINSEEAEFLSMLNVEKSIKDKYEIFSSVVASITLDGEKKKAKTNKKVSSVEMEIFISAAKHKLLTSIEEEIAKAVGLKRGISFQNLSYMHKSAVESVYDKDSYLLIGLGEEYTNLLSVQSGNIQGSVALPMGTNTVVRALADVYDEPFALAHSRLSMFLRGDITPESMEKADKSMRDIENKWTGLWDILPEEYKKPEVFSICQREYLSLANALIASSLPRSNINKIASVSSMQTLCIDKSGTSDPTLAVIAAFSASLLNTK